MGQGLAVVAPFVAGDALHFHPVVLGVRTWLVPPESHASGSRLWRHREDSPLGGLEVRSFADPLAWSGPCAVPACVPRML